MTNHDTQAIRRLAGELSNLATRLSQTERNTIRQVKGVSDDMIGDTPQAIDTAADKLGRELQEISDGFSRYAQSLNRYAHELDLADARASNLIESK